MARTLFTLALMLNKNMLFKFTLEVVVLYLFLKSPRRCVLFSCLDKYLLSNSYREVMVENGLYELKENRCF